MIFSSLKIYSRWNTSGRFHLIPQVFHTESIAIFPIMVLGFFSKFITKASTSEGFHSDAQSFPDDILLTQLEQQLQAKPQLPEVEQPTSISTPPTALVIDRAKLMSRCIRKKNPNTLRKQIQLLNRRDDHIDPIVLKRERGLVQLEHVKSVRLEKSKRMQLRELDRAYCKTKQRQMNIMKLRHDQTRRKL